MNTRPKITQEMIRLYDEYTHLTLDRRGFMEKLTKLAGGAAAAVAIAPMIAANKASAAMVAPDDARVATETVTFPSPAGDISGYLAKPADATGKLPTVVVIHENRGLNPHIQDVARRVALEGFVAMAPDFLSPQGGTPEDSDAAAQTFQSMDRAAAIAIAVAAAAYLRGRDDGNGNVGAVGFCWGGGMVNQLAVGDPNLKAAVAYYGPQPGVEEAANVKAGVMLHYAGLDERINAGIAAYEDALKAAGVEYEVFMYDGVNHAFNNDTSEARYNKEAADLAWSRTIDFFKKNLT
jgi:carboxymethylenebutenolidase